MLRASDCSTGSCMSCSCRAKQGKYDISLTQLANMTLKQAELYAAACRRASTIGHEVMQTWAAAHIFHEGW